MHSTFRSLNINGGGNGLVTKLCIHSCDSLNYSPAGYSKPSSTGYSKPSSNCIISPLSMVLSWQEYWSGLSYPSSEDFPDPRIEPRSTLQADSLPLSYKENPWTSIGSPSSLSLGSHKSFLCVCESVSVLWVGSFVSWFRFHI